MKRIGKYMGMLAAALWMLAAGSCVPGLNETRSDSPLGGVTFNADGTMSLPVGMAIPDMAAVATRALTENPDYTALQLYLLVFEQNTEGTYQLRQLAEFAPGEQTTTTDAVHNGRTLVTYTVTLEPTDRETVVHLVATDQSDFGDKIGYGTEESVMTALYTDEGHGAYWQRVALGSNIPSKEQAEAEADAAKKIEAIKTALSHVPVIRNFCRVSVVMVPEVKAKFRLTGLYVVNTVDQGSVAPYIAGTKTFVDQYEGKSYKDLNNQGYIGSLPAGVRIINKLDAITTKSEVGLNSTDEVEPVYFYERFARPIDPEQTYAIIRGSYNNEDESYYRIDLGFIREGDEIGIFEYYNLLRNFDYAIRLNGVESSGYETLAEAAQGVVYNNFSASVEARTMNSISDGEDMIFVNHTSFVFLRPGQEIELRAQFREKITDGTGGTVRNDLLKIKKEDGNVIEEGDLPDPKTVTGDDNREWNSYIVKGSSDPGPTHDLRWQTVYVYRGNKAAAGESADYGLYREITFYSHLPWSFLHIDTFPGLWLSPDEMAQWGWGSNLPREIGQSKGSPLTLFFELPAGIPQALFPMEFVIESDRQNIQNAYGGNAAVRSVAAGESLFATNAERGTKPSAWMTSDPTSTRIQYVKTVTWEEYNSDGSMGQVGTGSTIIRCRFLTITDLAQDGVGGTGNDSKSSTILRVYNEHFGQFDETSNSWKMYHEDSFTRVNSTSDPTPLVWDFASGENTDEKLEINGTYNNGGYYAGVSSIRFDYDYPGNVARTADLFITTTSDKKVLSFTNMGNGVTVPSDGYTIERVEGTDDKYLHHVKIAIPDTKEFTAHIVVDASPAIDVYRIEYYPQGVVVPESAD